jgi:hypothetical protein
MARVFVSHVASDAEAAGRVAAALEEAGHEVAVGRPDEPDRAAAVSRCDAVVLLATPAAVASPELTTEVVAASERSVPIVPVLAGVSHLDLTTRQPAWRSAIGAATAVEVPPEGLEAILPRVVAGVASVTAGSPVGAGAGGGSGRRTVALVAGLVAVVLALAGGAWWAIARDDGKTGAGAGVGPTASTSATPSPSATSTPVADSATTPVKSVAGNLRITRVRLLEKFCAGQSGEDCAVAPSGDRLVVLRVTGWDGQSLPYTEELAHQMDQAYVQSGDRSAGFTKAKQSFDQNSWEIAYVAVPASTRDLLLRWPGNPTLQLHPSGG